jgi:hypothetical protein
MTLVLLEAAVDALAAYIETNMAAKVAELNTRYTDITLGAGFTYYVGNLPQKAPDLLSVCVMGASMVPGRQFADMIEAQNNINVYLFVGENDVEDRFRRLCRYGIGLLELIHAYEASAEYTVRLGSRVEVTDAMNTQPFLQAVIVPVTMINHETY